MEFAAKSVTHPNNEVRSAAISLITEASQSVGEAQIEPFISGKLRISSNVVFLS